MRALEVGSGKAEVGKKGEGGRNEVGSGNAEGGIWKLEYFQL